MKYFEMKQDLRIKYTYSIKNLEWKETQGENVGTAYFTGNEESLPDFIEYKKNFFVSSELKKVINMYTDEVSFDLVIFNNIEEMLQREYYKLEAEPIFGLHEDTTYNKDGSVNKKVLSYKKLKDYEIFRLKELEPTQFSKHHIFVHLDIVESSLRRKLWGMIFEKTVLGED